jgi:hypothetical protein
MTRTLGPDRSNRAAAPPGMRELVMRAGLRRRRVAFAGAGSAAAVALVAAAGVLIGSTAGPDSLRINQPAGGQTAQSSPVAAVAGGDFRRTPGTTSRATTAQGGNAAAPQPRPLAAPAPSRSPSAAPHGNQGMHEPVTRTDREFGQVCQGDQMQVGPGGVSTSGWCITVAPPGAHDTTPYPMLTFTVCRSSAKDSGALTFDTPQEVELVISVTSTKKSVWTWSHGQRFRAGRHVLHMGSSQCSDWQTHWNWRDDNGRSLPAGERLTLTAWSMSAELKHFPVTAELRA